MSFCPTCGAAMKPLFVGEYCPRDCDRPRSDTTQPLVLLYKTTSDVYSDAVMIHVDGLGFRVILKRGRVHVLETDLPAGRWRYGGVEATGTDEVTWKLVRDD